MAVKTSKRLYAGREARDRVRERRRRFVEAGFRLFGTQGYAATTIKQLCAEAGLTERYFYESFESREALFMAVAAECVTGLFGSLTLARTRGENPSDQTEALLRAFFGWFYEDPRRIRIQLVDPMLISSVTQEVYVEVVRLFVQFAADLAMDWYELSADEPKIDADLVGTMLVGGLVEMVKEWARGGFERPIDEVVRNAKLPFDAIAQVLAPRRGA
ncbi:MAG: TetR/AcrR family transcriptional regulator [Myxococcales bacterium]|nr:TetR/AcrR family transcriptional regulator [Myxococcales bacterium]